MKTPQTDDIARGNHVVPTEWAQQLERERDEARESTLRIDVLNFKLRKELDDAKSKIKSQADRIRYLEGATNHAKGTPLSVALRERDEARESLKHISEYGTDEINAAVELRQKLATALVERDEAREDLENWKSEYEIVVSRLCGIKHERDNGIITENEIIPVLRKERDDAREKAERYRREANKFMLQRDEALSQIVQAECRAERFCQERDDAREEVRLLKGILDLLKKEAQ